MSRAVSNLSSSSINPSVAGFTIAGAPRLQRVAVKVDNDQLRALLSKPVVTPTDSWAEVEESPVLPSEETKGEVQDQALPMVIPARMVRPRTRRGPAVKGNRATNRVETFRMTDFVSPVSTNAGGVLTYTNSLANLVTGANEYSSIVGLFDSIYLKSITAYWMPFYPPTAAGGSQMPGALTMAVDWDSNVTPVSFEQVWRYDNAVLSNPFPGGKRMTRANFVQPRSRVPNPWQSGGTGQLGSFFMYSAAGGLASTAVGSLVFEMVVECRQRY